jgi:tRNA dimethylallyltransferase
MLKKVFCLMGPTAIGKTDLACLLSEHFPFELVNVDSSLIYQELNIGSAKPSPEILLKYPHHLINLCDLKRVYSVADFCHDVKNVCQAIFARGRYPLLVGGTMMYFNAFQQGLAKLPSASLAIREQLLSKASQVGWMKMYEELAEFDPKTAKRLHPHDQQRMLRAYEVFLQTGKPWSSYLNDHEKPNEYVFYNLALFPEPRAWLHENIAKRFQQMIQEGFIEEVDQILKMPEINLEHHALRSVGYRQAIMSLKGELAQDLWQEKAIVATRQLAKRQMTWLRSFDDKQQFFQPNLSILQEIIDCINKILDNN